MFKCSSHLKTGLCCKVLEQKYGISLGLSRHYQALASALESPFEEEIKFFLFKLLLVRFFVPCSQRNPNSVSRTELIILYTAHP